MTKFLVDKTENIQKGSIKKITAAGKDVVVANVNGKFFAINNICNHAGAELHEGILNGKELTCPWHAAKWNLETGELIWFPQQLKNQESYKVIVEGDNLYVEV